MPHPDGPSTASTRRTVEVQADVVDRDGGPEADGQVVDVQHVRTLPSIRRGAAPRHAMTTAVAPPPGRRRRRAPCRSSRLRAARRAGRSTTGSVGTVRPRQEAGRPELAERDREGEAGAGQQRPPRQRQVDGREHAQRAGAQRRRGLALPVVDAAQDRARPCARRAAARPSPVRSARASPSCARSSGGRSRVTRKPKPDGHRRDAERQHEEPVEEGRARDARRHLAAPRDTRTDDEQARGATASSVASTATRSELVERLGHRHQEGAAVAHRRRGRDSWPATTPSPTRSDRRTRVAIGSDEEAHDERGHAGPGQVAAAGVAVGAARTAGAARAPWSATSPAGARSRRRSWSTDSAAAACRSRNWVVSR